MCNTIPPFMSFEEETENKIEEVLQNSGYEIYTTELELFITKDKRIAHTILYLYKIISEIEKKKQKSIKSSFIKKQFMPRYDKEYYNFLDKLEAFSLISKSKDNKNNFDIKIIVKSFTKNVIDTCLRCLSDSDE